MPNEGMPNELREIEVDEVSLVDRPATGRRFVLFKRAARGGLLRRSVREGVANIRSEAAGPDARPGEVEELRKRTDQTESALADLRAHAARLEQRLETIERARPARQSEEAGTPAAGSIWSGIL